MLAPTKIGTSADYNLSWNKGSILNRLTEERADASAALIQAGRDARHAFGSQANEQLQDALAIVTRTANELGVNLGDQAQALLDSHSISFGSGNIALHNADGIPLKAMGIGSNRLLISGLQRSTIAGSTIVLADELEYGLEPHRIVSFLRSLGSKEPLPTSQVFATTHSPIVLRELNGHQLTVLRTQDEGHFVANVGKENDLQGTIRLFPEAFLAPSVIVCEGATEVGFLRGLDLYRSDQGEPSLTAQGASFVDIGGGHPDQAYKRALAFQKLGYRVMVVRDADIEPDAQLEQQFEEGGGAITHWQAPLNLEQELFRSLAHDTCLNLLHRALALHEGLVDDHLRSASQGAVASQTVNDHYSDTDGKLSPEIRQYLGNASSNKQKGWFKNIGVMEDVTREIIAPDLNRASFSLQEKVLGLYEWVEGANA